MNIGEKIKKVRELKNFKQDYVATKLDMSVTAYGNIERGFSDLNFKKLEEIASVLDVTVNEIISIPDNFTFQHFTNSHVGVTCNDNRVITNDDVNIKIVSLIDKMILLLDKKLI